MSTVISDPYIEQSLIEDRRAKGLDRWDEVWEGVYQIMPAANDEHQDIVLGISIPLRTIIQDAGLGVVRPGVNVSDRHKHWKENYRVPDVVVFLNETTAECHDTFWYGGPDLAIEIVSPGDRTREKFDFYASVNTRELLLVDRDPWQLELHRLTGSTLQLVGRSTPTEPTVLTSEVVPLTWRLTEGDPRPRIEITHRDDGEQWLV